MGGSSVADIVDELCPSLDKWIKEYLAEIIEENTPQNEGDLWTIVSDFFLDLHTDEAHARALGVQLYERICGTRTESDESRQRAAKSPSAKQNTDTALEEVPKLGQRATTVWLTNTDGFKVRGIDGGCEVLDAGSQRDILAGDIIEVIDRMPLKEFTSAKAAAMFEDHRQKMRVEVQIDPKEVASSQAPAIIADIARSTPHLYQMTARYGVETRIVGDGVQVCGPRSRLRQALSEVADLDKEMGMTPKQDSHAVRRPVASPMQATVFSPKFASCAASSSASAHCIKARSPTTLTHTRLSSPARNVKAPPSSLTSVPVFQGRSFLGVSAQTGPSMQVTNVEASSTNTAGSALAKARSPNGTSEQVDPSTQAPNVTAQTASSTQALNVKAPPAAISGQTGPSTWSLNVKAPPAGISAQTGPSTRAPNVKAPPAKAVFSTPDVEAPPGTVNDDGAGSRVSFRPTRSVPEYSDSDGAEAESDLRIGVDAWAQLRTRVTPTRGVVVRTMGDFGFIKPRATKQGQLADIYFHFEKVKGSGGLPLVEGDEVAFSLDTREGKGKGKGRRAQDSPPAQYVEAERLKRRRPSEVAKLLLDAMERLNCKVNMHGKEGDVVQTFGCKQGAFWKLCAEVLDEEHLPLLFNVPVALRRAGAGSCALQAVCDSAVYDPTRTGAKLLKQLVRGFPEHDAFVKEVCRQCPNKLQCFVPIFRALVDDSPEAPNIAQTLVMLFSVTAFAAAGHDVEDVALQGWQTLPLVPTRSELLGHDTHTEVHASLQRVAVPSVLRQGPYKDINHYFNTYVRLLREDGFDALKKGVQQYMKRKLEQRDMRTYSAQLVGLHVLTRSGIALVLQVNAHQRIKDYKTTDALMFGNLLCISPDHRFRDPIWATVLDRDADLLNAQGLITVELVTVDGSRFAFVDTLKRFIEAEVCIVCESPTYYRAYQPVLETLISTPLDTAPFIQELVDVTPVEGVPQYLRRSTALDASIIFDKDTNTHSIPHMSLIRDYVSRSVIDSDSDCDERSFFSDGSDDDDAAHARRHIVKSIRRREKDRFFSELCAMGIRDLECGTTVDAILKHLETNGVQSTLDSFQLDAVKHVLTHRMSIIQGGPGCGKSTLGRRLMRLLLSADPGNQILCVTYKNHSLDDLLEGVYDFFPTSIARIGGRSASEKLEARNLSKLRFQRSEEKFVLLNSMRDIKSHMESLLSGLQQSAECFAASFEFSPGVLWRRAPDQVEQFLTNTWFGASNARNALRHVRQRRWNLVERLAFGTSSFDNRLRGFLHSAIEEWLPASNPATARAATLLSKIGQHSDAAADECEDMDLEEIKLREFERLVGVSTKKSREFLGEMINLKVREGTVKFSSTLFAEIEPWHEMQLRKMDMWDMDVLDRAHFVQLLLSEELSIAEADFSRQLEEYQALAAELQHLEEMVSVLVLREQRIVGATCTGVCLKQNLITMLKPKIVLIEEAAELLEPHVLACIGPWVEHLIMIGDHWQLPPSVNSYALKKEHSFNLSLMERLIINRFPHAKLMKQSRMRPETSALLRPRYQQLEDNLSVVSALPDVECCATNVFWWDHDHPEQVGRSPSNPDEAEMVLHLVFYLILQGEHASKITILSPYVGQVQVLKRQAQKFLPRVKSILNITDAESELSIDIQPLDRFQGAENEIIVVSMVRCNDEYKCGFLEADSGLNRRVVMQSRNRRALYIVGNRKTFEYNRTRHGVLQKSDVYSGFITQLQENNFIGSALSLTCPRHQDARLLARTAADVPLTMQKTVCRKPCGMMMECGLHRCPRQCHFVHKSGDLSHLRSNCTEKVEFKCRTLLEYARDAFRSDGDNKSGCADRSGHPMVRYCYQEETEVACKAQIEFTCERHEHPLHRECATAPARVLCKAVIPDKCPQQHDIDVYCYMTSIEAAATCQKLCGRRLACGHTCKRPCGKLCDAQQCREQIDFVCDALEKHRNTCECRARATKRCEAMVDFACAKGKHPRQRKCYQSEDNAGCPVACTLTLRCGHSCDRKCDAPCPTLPSQCSLCCRERDIVEAQMQEQQRVIQQEARLRAERKLQELKNNPPADKMRLMLDKSQSAEFSEVATAVRRMSAQVGCHIKAITVEKLVDGAKDRAYLESMTSMVDCVAPAQRVLFWCRGRARDSILQRGFQARENDFGVCVDFKPNMDDADGFVFFCDVLVGKKWTVSRDHPDAWTLVSENAQSMKARGYDSLFAVQDGENPEQLAIYDARRVCARYLVKYKRVNDGGDLGSMPPYWTTGECTEWKIQPVTSEEAEALKKCIVIGGSLGGRDTREEGKHKGVKYALGWRLENPGLWAMYAANRSAVNIDFTSLQKEKIETTAVKIRDAMHRGYKMLPASLDPAINEVYLSHGTGPDIIMKILTAGLNERFSRPGFFGEGIYFAEDVAKNDQYVKQDAKFDESSILHKCLYKGGTKHPGNVFYIFLCRVVLGAPWVTRTCFSGRELAQIPRSKPPVLYHSLLAETGESICRYREFVQFHGGRIYPEYLIAYQRC